MKNWLLVVFTSLAALQLSANEMLGGEITWQCDGNKNYIFEVVFYEDCSLQTSAVANTVPIHWNGGAPINCALVDSSIISPTCNSPFYSINCDSTYVYSPIKRYVYNSAPTQLNGTIPNNGWTFSVIHTTRRQNTNLASTFGYTLCAYMFPYVVNGSKMNTNLCYDNSPSFGEKPRYAFVNDSNYYNLDGYDVDTQDSIQFAWAPAWNQWATFPGTPVNYATNYSYTNPLPGVLVNSNNANVTLSPTGLMAFNSQTDGRFTTCYKIESYREGQKIAEVYRDFEMQIFADPGSPGVCATINNSIPTIAFDWVAGFDTLNAVKSNGKTLYYEMTVFAGTPIKFNVKGSDFDLKPNCTPQQIQASATGANMSLSYNGSQDCYSGSCANLSSLNANGTFTAALESKVQFNWTPDTNHAVGSNGSGENWFTLDFNDGHCILPGINNVKVKIVVLRPIYAPKTEFTICQGDTAKPEIRGATSNLVWSPATQISCTTCANPKLYPTSNTTYTATDANTGFTVDIDVIVDLPSAAPTITKSGNNITVTNANLYDTIVWRFNSAPFTPTSNSTYTALLSGQYWVDGINGVCAVKSDTLDYWFADNLTANSAESASHTIAAENNFTTYGATLRLDQESFYRLDGFYLLALDKNPISPDLSSLVCKVYDQQQNKIYETDSVSRVNTEFVKFFGDLTLSTNQDYLVTFYADTNLQIPLYKPIKFPVIANNSRVYIYNAAKGAGNFIPSVSAKSYPYFNISLKSFIGIQEDQVNAIQVYPNPATNRLIIQSSAKGMFELVNGVGQVVLKGNVDDNIEVDVSALKAGIYLVKVSQLNGSTTMKKIIITK